MTSVQGQGRHSLEPAIAPVAAPSFAALVRVELRRLRSRRFAQVLVGIGMLGYVVGLVLLVVDEPEPPSAVVWSGHRGYHLS